MKQPRVSVVMITYNHESYIEEAINSIMMQRCDFDVELIVSNDNSVDGTNEIIQKLLEQNYIPAHMQVHYHNHEHNKGMMSNFIWSLKQAQGKYIALCEGDDYWTDPLKLQKQVDFLEENEDYSGCFHNALIHHTNTGKEILFFKEFNGRRTYGTEHLFDQWVVPTASFMFKNKWNNYNIINNLPQWFTTIGSGDLALILLVSLKGKIWRFDDVMCVYRRHNEGLTAVRAGDPIQFLILGHMYFLFNEETNNTYLDALKKGFDAKLKNFYKDFFKEEFKKNQSKNIIDYNNEELYQKLGLKKIIKLMLYSLRKKLFTR